MADGDEIQYLEYSEESPFVRAAVEEEKKKKEEEEKEKERTVGRKKRKYKLDENSVSLGWRIYAIAIITLLNFLNFTQQYLPIVTISGMANDFEFGETECRVINETLAGEYLRDFNLTGDPEELCSEMGRCSENSTLFLPDVCQLQYTGRGTLYEILAGPSNLVIQGVLSIPLLGLFQRFSFRPPFVIGLFSMLWTLCTFVTAYVHDYWAIVFLRILFGVFSGPYIPVVFAYLATICPKRVHAVVFGIAHYACVAGYGIAYLFILVSDTIGWRWCYFICGATGVLVAIGSCLMINPKVLYPLGQSCQSRTLRPSWKQQRAGLRQIAWSLMLSVILSNTARIAAFCVFSFNITFYLVEYFPDFNVVFLSWVTLVSSCTGCIFGGLLSDQLRKTAGVRGRLWLSLILMIIALVSSPFIFQTQVTIAVTLVGIYLAVSDWFYVVNLAVISDLTPLECKTIIFALNFFFTYSVGGAANLAVAPLTSLISLRTALTILCGLLSGLTVILQLISLGVIECLKEIFRNLTERADPSRDEGVTEADETTPLTMSYRSFDSNTIATTVTIENPT